MRENNEILEKQPREFWINAIAQWVNDEKARYCLVRNFLDKIPYNKIAEELNISDSTVYRKIRKYKKKLFNHIKE
jgi:DNA invertase Pin-like site-specific DNA recombinase